MDIIKIWEVNGVEMVTIKESDDLYRTMTKAHYEAQLEAQKELGGTL